MTDPRTPLIVDLPEGLLLLATDDVSGRIDTKSGALDYGLAGAVLTELVLQGSLRLQDGKVRLATTEVAADPLHAEVLGRIAADRPKDAKHWVNKLPHAQIRQHLLDRLVDKGIVRREEHRLLWIVPDNRYPAEADAPERHVRDAVRAAVLNGDTPQPRIGVLIGILKACDLLGTVFTKDERKRRQQRIDQIANGEVVSKAVSDAIKEMQAATMAAVIAATTAATVSSSSNSS
jgi:hypothetical protein